MDGFSRLYLLPFLMVFVGCAAREPGQDIFRQQELISLLMPSRIEIVEPFTKIKSFDDDTTPDGIELLLQAANSMNDLGRRIAGPLRVELYEYLPATADPKGKQLDQWDIELSTPQRQARYWNRLTQMYEFMLGVDPERIPGTKKFVLLVTYTSPLGDHLTDDCILQYRPRSTPLGTTPTPAP